MTTCTSSKDNFQAVFQQAEALAYPAVFRGLNASWPALQLWAGLEGLQHLKEAAGDATVQVCTDLICLLAAESMLPRPLKMPAAAVALLECQEEHQVVLSKPSRYTAETTHTSNEAGC
jgi:hypothetical protein